MNEIDNPSKPQASPDARASAIVGKTIQFDGNIKGDENLIIKGLVEGTINLNGKCLTVAKGGIVRGDVLAKMILIEGEVRGELRGTESVEIAPSGIVNGDIRAPRVSLRDGCQFKGMVDMDHKEPGGADRKRPAQPISPMMKKSEPLKRSSLPTSTIPNLGNKLLGSKA